MSEALRRLGNRDKLLAYLQQHRRATNAQLLAVAGMRFGARILELRAEHDIETEPQRAGGVVWYRYIGPKVPGQVGLPFSQEAA